MLTRVSSETTYEKVGGQIFFDGLADRFYDLVESDAPFLSMYPNPVDLSEARLHLAQFLGQYWGGPNTYSETRGHPRLRMRHAGFKISLKERDTWLGYMLQALEASPGLADDTRHQMTEYFEMAANHLVNYEGDSA